MTDIRLLCARAYVNDSRARRKTMPHIPHQVAFQWTLMNWAADARMEYLEMKAQKPVMAAQGALFGVQHG